MGAIIDKIKGKAKKAEGRMTGDKLRTAQGHGLEAKGEVEGAASRVARKAKTGARRMKAKVRRASSRASSRSRQP
jgi:uncharacterized protein YjbJ (UPF0337 family)